MVLFVDLVILDGVVCLCRMKESSLFLLDLSFVVLMFVVDNAILIDVLLLSIVVRSPSGPPFMKVDSSPAEKRTTDSASLSYGLEPLYR